MKEVPLENHVEQLALPEADRPDVTGVLHALGRLPFNQRAALVMRELEGRSYAEIADTIGVSVSAVETLIFRARKSLRLKASALRALAVVPLPGSLTQLFESGGAVTGGGAAVGTGFLVKAAVALVAGAVATGVGGDRSGPTAAEAGSTPQLAAAQSWHRAGGFVARPSSLARHGKSTRAVTRHRPAGMGSVTVPTGITHRGSVVGASGAMPRRAGVQAGSPGQRGITCGITGNAAVGPSREPDRRRRCSDDGRAGCADRARRPARPGTGRTAAADRPSQTSPRNSAALAKHGARFRLGADLLSGDSPGVRAAL